MESQDDASQLWLEEVFRGKQPLFLSDPYSSGDDRSDVQTPPSPRVREEDHPVALSDSDKENDPPLRVPLLPWPERRRAAEILTRLAAGHQTIARGHQTIATAMGDMRDLVLGMPEASVEEKVGYLQQKEGDLEVEGKDTKTDRDTTEEKNSRANSEVPTAPSQQDVLGPIFSGLIDSLAYRLEPGFNSQNSAAVSSAASQRASARSLELSSGFFKSPSEVMVQSQAAPSQSISTAAVLADALNKRKADDALQDPEPEVAPRRKPKRRVPIVYNETESQIERRKKYAEEHPRTFKGPSRRRTWGPPPPRSTQEILDEYEETLRQGGLLEDSESE